MLKTSMIVEKVATSELPFGMMKSDAHAPQNYQFINSSTNRVRTHTIAEMSNVSPIYSDASISSKVNVKVDARTERMAVRMKIVRT